MEEAARSARMRRPVLHKGDQRIGQRRRALNKRNILALLAHTMSRTVGRRAARPWVLVREGTRIRARHIKESLQRVKHGPAVMARPNHSIAHVSVGTETAGNRFRPSTDRRAFPLDKKDRLNLVKQHVMVRNLAVMIISRHGRAGMQTLHPQSRSASKLKGRPKVMMVVVGKWRSCKVHVHTHNKAANSHPHALKTIMEAAASARLLTAPISPPYLRGTRSE